MVALEQHFGVATGKEPVTEAFQLGAQFGVVVDGAVEHHRQAQVRCTHGLSGRLVEVHDLQAAMAEAQWPLAVEAARVGTARGEVVGDTGEGGEIRRLPIET
ncbi:hypothetical protein D3C77_559460 [compost metagenome]